MDKIVEIRAKPPELRVWKLDEPKNLDDPDGGLSTLHAEIVSGCQEADSPTIFLSVFSEMDWLGFINFDLLLF
ncbi:MAG: hypothetical protein ACSHX6_09055 [Akkermansiaceae bacterium]